MSDQLMGENAPELDLIELAAEESAQARATLLRRLVDVVALPASAAGLQDRSIAGDLLLELLVDVDEDARRICAERLAGMSETPRRVLRFLAQDVASVSEPVLRESKGLDQSDLANVARHGAPHHRAAIAQRRDIGPCLSDAMVDSADLAGVLAMVNNETAQLSDFAVDRLVSWSRDEPQLARALLRRSELRPAHALVMFWWAERSARVDILLRFSAERLTLIEKCSDLFAIAAKEKWNDPIVRKGLQVIERRQRNRQALERSPHDSLEDAVAKGLKLGVTRDLADEICYLSGIKPLTGAKIFADPGGEGLAVLCKAVGLKRQYFKALWQAMGRSVGRPEEPDPDFSDVMELYETLAVAKAQTVLRYWNWSLSASFSPEIVDSPILGDDDFDPNEGPTMTSTRLVFGRR